MVNDSSMTHSTHKKYTIKAMKSGTQYIHRHSLMHEQEQVSSAI